MQNGTNEPVQVEVKISQNGHVVSESVSGQRHQTSLKRTLIVKSGKLSARLKDPKEWRKLLSNEKLKTTAFHLGIVAFCMVYMLLGAMVFYKIERPLELEHAKNFDMRLDQQNFDLLQKAEELKKESKEEFEAKFLIELENHESILFDEFEHPVSANYFESLVSNNATYMDMWSMSSAILLATTTIIPVGYGLITPRSTLGRLLLVIYAICGIPLALVTISDVGRFLCDAIFRLFKQSTNTAIWILISMAILYPLIGGLFIWHYSTLNLIDSFYYCIITSLTIGFGDISPPIDISLLIAFITFGVILMTVSIEVVGTNVIHQIHFMGRQVGKARHLAGRFIQMAQLNVSTGLGFGMNQITQLAKFGIFWFPSRAVNVENNEEFDEQTAFEPQIPDLKFVDF